MSQSPLYVALTKRVRVAEEQARQAGEETAIMRERFLYYQVALVHVYKHLDLPLPRLFQPDELRSKISIEVDDELRSPG